MRPETFKRGTSFVFCVIGGLHVPEDIPILLTETNRLFGREVVILKDFQSDFKKAFGAALKSAGLKNFKGGDDYAAGDEFHVELPETKLAASDKRVLACFDEYAKLTRKDGKDQNKKFEKDYDKEIAKAVERKGLAKKK